MHINKTIVHPVCCNHIPSIHSLHSIFDSSLNTWQEEPNQFLQGCNQQWHERFCEGKYCQPWFAEICQIRHSYEQSISGDNKEQTWCFSAIIHWCTKNIGLKEEPTLCWWFTSQSPLHRPYIYKHSGITWTDKKTKYHFLSVLLKYIFTLDIHQTNF